jgi:hypothetical protein
MASSSSYNILGPMLEDREVTQEIFEHNPCGPIGGYNSCIERINTVMLILLMVFTEISNIYGHGR